MKNIAIINAVSLSGFAFEAIGGKEHAFARLAACARTLPETEKLIVITDADIEPPDGRFAIIKKSEWDTVALLGVMKEQASGFDAIFYFYADCPFLDPVLSKKMYENHTRYFADYSFADGYPYGLAPEIISTRITGQLEQLASKDPVPFGRESVFDVVKKDINSFDVETELSPVDQRFLRARLCADSKRNHMLLDAIARAGGHDAESITGLLAAKPEMLRTLPAYFSIQIAERCPHECVFCPYPKGGKDVTKASAEMAYDDVIRIVDRIAAFADDAYIDISLWGEPAYHSRIGDIIKNVCGRPGLELVIETTGIGWNRAHLESIASGKGKKPLWIVGLDASTREAYGKVRGTGFDEASQSIGHLLELFPGRVYVQAVRMMENEEDVELFFNKWKLVTPNIIIQKYDHFCGFLPQKKVTDLSPLERMTCWHIKRDISVLIDGTVPLCREDLEKKYVLGNIFNDPIESIWENGKKHYLDHVGKQYNGMCSNCDEYYTYNF